MICEDTPGYSDHNVERAAGGRENVGLHDAVADGFKPEVEVARCAVAGRNHTFDMVSGISRRSRFPVFHASLKRNGNQVFSDLHVWHDKGPQLPS